jgi:hypothetical protein
MPALTRRRDHVVRLDPLIQVKGALAPSARTEAMRRDNLWFAISVAWLVIVLGAAVYVFVI